MILAIQNYSNAKIKVFVYPILAKKLVIVIVRKVSMAIIVRIKIFASIKKNVIIQRIVSTPKMARPVYVTTKIIRLYGII